MKTTTTITNLLSIQCTTPRLNTFTPLLAPHSRPGRARSSSACFSTSHTHTHNTITHTHTHTHTHTARRPQKGHTEAWDRSPSPHLDVQSSSTTTRVALPRVVVAGSDDPEVPAYSIRCLHTHTHTHTHTHARTLQMRNVRPIFGKRKYTQAYTNT